MGTESLGELELKKNIVKGSIIERNLDVNSYPERGKMETDVLPIGLDYLVNLHRRNLFE